MHRASALLTVTLLAATACGSEVAGRAVPDAWVPTADNPDPSRALEGIEVVEYPPAYHVLPDYRVAYRYSPPMGGRHDGAWATCTGVVYPVPVRTENMVHSLEHGAVWIAYDPDSLDDTDVADLARRVEGVPYTMMSPYPGLDRPISLQSWGHRLQVDDADDERIDRFVTALRLNPNTFPEPGATCATLPSSFDPTDPPPFVAEPADPDSPLTVPE
ncbi:DUF3105 domain-containing protein [Rhodococcoides corynebacterioides]|uniref:DUF3105 domain-containing protein n=1 Tax=Rhodococcoides corynebacterioides TaxID=53972 RepID=UPI00082A0DEA|nr:DUF3105 domain-containing protein [Rhodococcus corynebacterioides]